jgi:hypothetical protein
MFNIFMDPEGAAKNVRLSWSWAPPLVLSSLIIAICGYLLIPTTLRAMQINPPGNMSPADLEKAMPMIQFTQKLGAIGSPVIIAIFALIGAGILTGVCAVLDISSRFKQNFSLVCHAGLIGAVGYLAGFVVVMLNRDSIQSLRDLRPGFGFDLLLSEGANRFLHAVLNFFSLFMLWHILMLGLTFAALTRVSKGKAFGATAPVWMLGLIFALLGAAFLG